MSEDRSNQIHDCFVDVFDRVPTRKELYFINVELPRDIKFLAEQWGWNDTEVRDKIFTWIKKNRGLIK